MANIEAIRQLVRFQSDAWITAKLESLRDELSSGRQFTSISEAGKSHSEESLLPIADTIQAVTDVSYERGLNAANNTKGTRSTYVRFA